MTKTEFLEIASKRYESINSLNGLDNFYDYEKQFVGILHDLGKELLEKNLGEVSDNYRKKNAIHNFGTSSNK
jgi:HD superfamily phosphohydrolase YqeK